MSKKERKRQARARQEKQQRKASRRAVPRSDPQNRMEPGTDNPVRTVEVAPGLPRCVQVKFDSEQLAQLSNRRNGRLELASVVVATLATLAAGWSAMETRRNVVEANRAVKATVWTGLIKDYGSAEMLADMKCLRRFKHDTQEQFASEFQRLLSHPVGDDEIRLAEQLDVARRRVRKFFDLVQVFAEADIVDEGFVKSTWPPSTAGYIRDVLVPLEMAKGEFMLKSGAINELESQVSRERTERLLSFFVKLLDSR